MRSIIGKFGIGILTLATVGFAADSTPKFGVQGGVSISTLNPPSGYTAQSITGFAAGILLDVPLNEALSVQPEVLFVQRGADIAGSGSSGVSSKYNSIDVPVFLKAGLGKDVRATIFAGPNFSYALSNSLVANAGGNIGSLTFNPNTLDIGFAGGAGVEMGPVMINVRYVAGFVNVNNGGASWNSRGFLGLVGLKL